MKKLMILSILLLFLVAISGHSVDLIGYPSANKIFISWYNSGEQIIGLYRFAENEKPDLRQKKPLYISKQIRNGYEIKKILGERYEDIAVLLELSSPEEVPYALDRLSGIENLICTLTPELAVIRGQGFIDHNVQAGITYQYVIATMRKKGNAYKADKIQAKIIITARELPLLPPVLENAIGHDRKINLYFSNSESPNAGIDIYRGESENGPFIKVNKGKIMIAGNYPANLPCYSDINIIPNKNYWYALKAADIFGRESIFSNALQSISYGCDIDQKPVIHKIIPVKDEYVLTWTHQFDENVKHYTIYRSAEYQKLGEPITEQVLPNLSGEYSFVLKGVGNRYDYYTVSAVSKRGDCEVFSFQQIYRTSRIN